MAIKIDSDSDLDTRRKRVLFDFLSRRGAGEGVSIKDFEADYPELMPELRDMLEGGLKKLRQAITTDHPTQSLVRGYAFRREISGGGQGTVYEALQESTGQTVAVKVFRPTNRNAVARFEREVAALAGLSHPGVVRIFDCGRTSDGNYFLAMEYVAGSDLDQWIEDQRGRPSFHKILIDCFIGIAEAVGAAHAAGIIHRDLKPSNIRVDSSGRPRVIDFGLASLANEMSARDITMTGNVVGSIRWTSPEQASGLSKTVTAASDVYSLGVLLYESLSSHSPYDVDGPLHTITRSICETRPNRLDRLPSDETNRISKALADVVQTCLVKQPKSRFASATALAESLKAAQLKVQRGRSKRWRYLFIAAGLLLVTSIVVARRQAARPSPVVSVTQNRVELPLLTNSIGMRFRQIPTRQFRIGSPPNESGRSVEEIERTSAVPAGFWMAETEVTRDQFRLIMHPDTASLSPAEASLPVTRISWTDAVRFCKIISEREQRDYRLPSEDEWEICCRAASRTPFAIPDFESKIWMKSTSGQMLHPVYSSPANDWGLFEMSGNAAEWTSTIAQSTELLSDSEKARSVLTFRTTRGGSATSELLECRSSDRSTCDEKLPNSYIGFRPAILFVK